MSATASQRKNESKLPSSVPATSRPSTSPDQAHILLLRNKLKPRAGEAILTIRSKLKPQAGVKPSGIEKNRTETGRVGTIQRSLAQHKAGPQAVLQLEQALASVATHPVQEREVRGKRHAVEQEEAMAHQTLEDSKAPIMLLVRHPTKFRDEATSGTNKRSVDVIPQLQQYVPPDELCDWDDEDMEKCSNDQEKCWKHMDEDEEDESMEIDYPEDDNFED